MTKHHWRVWRLGAYFSSGATVGVFVTVALWDLTHTVATAVTGWIA